MNKDNERKAWKVKFRDTIPLIVVTPLAILTYYLIMYLQGKDISDIVFPLVMVIAILIGVTFIIFGLIAITNKISDKPDQLDIGHQGKKLDVTTRMQCPKCHSDDIFVMGENKKAFSVKKAAAGALLTGGVGAIAGFAGKKNGYDCYCGECKHRFILK